MNERLVDFVYCNWWCIKSEKQPNDQSFPLRLRWVCTKPPREQGSWPIYSCSLSGLLVSKKLVIFC